MFSDLGDSITGSVNYLCHLMIIEKSRMRHDSLQSKPSETTASCNDAVAMRPTTRESNNGVVKGDSLEWCSNDGTVMVTIGVE